MFLTRLKLVYPKSIKLFNVLWISNRNIDICVASQVEIMIVSMPFYTIFEIKSTEYDELIDIFFSI